MSIQCPFCGSSKVFKAGFRASRSGERIQRYLCCLCGRRFSLKPPPNPGEEPNVLVKSRGASNPVEDLAQVDVVVGLSGEPGFQDLPLPPAEELGMHTSRKSRKGLNSLLHGFEEHGRTRSERGSPASGEKMNPEKGDGVETLVLATGAGPGRIEIQGDPEVISFAFWLKKQGLAERSINIYVLRLNQLVKQGANLNNPESVKEVLANNGKSETWKALAVAAYSKFLKFKGLSWEPPKIVETRKLPFIPLESELDALIAGCGSKTSTLLQLLKETGLRCGEALRLRWSDIDFERRVIILNRPEKNSNPRIFKVSDRLMGMLKALPKKDERVFSCTYHSVQATFAASRRRIAKNLNNPRLLKISFHTFRHWKGTLEYHKTKDILHVKELLGHRSINNTLLYVQIDKTLFNEDSDEFEVRVAKDPEEIKSLLEVGFEYVCEKDGLMFFRKRK
jgi:integrase